MSQSWHAEAHFSQRIGWLRASVLGANDGVVSTASIVVGVAAAVRITVNLVFSGSLVITKQRRATIRCIQSRMWLLKLPFNSQCSFALRLD